jgi:hypothetical protein
MPLPAANANRALAYPVWFACFTCHFAQIAKGEGRGEGETQLSLIDAGEEGEYRLPLAENAAILKNNLFGVDIDPQAVEITMMSLYVKLLEGERGAILDRRVLPPLRDNIKCGNSLIGYDILELGLRSG